MLGIFADKKDKRSQEWLLRKLQEELADLVAIPSEPGSQSFLRYFISKHAKVELKDDREWLVEKDVSDHLLYGLKNKIGQGKHRSYSIEAMYFEAPNPTLTVRFAFSEDDEIYSPVKERIGISFSPENF